MKEQSLTYTKTTFALYNDKICFVQRRHLPSFNLNLCSYGQLLVLVLPGNVPWWDLLRKDVHSNILNKNKTKFIIEVAKKKEISCFAFLHKHLLANLIERIGNIKIDK